MNWNKNALIIRFIAGGLFLGIVLLVFSGAALFFSGIFKFQGGPFVMRSAAAASGAVVMGAILLILTVLTGRIYCSILCPLGLIQDIFILIFHRKGKAQKDFFLLRYLLAGIVIGGFFCGSNLGFLLLGPYSNAGRILASFSLGGAVVLAVLILLVIWKKRFFCTSLCPVGTLLGGISRFAVCRMSISDTCVQCGKCAGICPSGCIDIANKTIDNERCVRCMACLPACPKGCISFRPGKPEKTTSAGRRRFLISAGAFLAGAAAGGALAKSGLLEIRKKMKILPPGAGDPQRFSQKCTACMLCAVNCPADIIVPSPSGMGAVELDLSNGACSYNCNRCGEVCPTGAVPYLALSEKRKIKIAEAKFDPRNCIVFQNGEKCGKCAKACPTGAITLRRKGTPRPVKKHLCIGCGACQEVCPASEKAMTVSPIKKQIVLQIEGE